MHSTRQSQFNQKSFCWSLSMMATIPWWFMQGCAQLSFQHTQGPNLLALQQAHTVLSFTLTCSKKLHTCFKRRTASVLDLPTGGGGQPCSSVPSEQSGCPSQRLAPRMHRVRSHMNSPSAHSANVHTITVLLVLRQGFKKHTQSYIFATCYMFKEIPYNIYNSRIRINSPLLQSKLHLHILFL
jgi:hypothetical protein